MIFCSVISTFQSYKNFTKHEHWSLHRTKEKGRILNPREKVSTARRKTELRNQWCFMWNISKIKLVYRTEIFCNHVSSTSANQLTKKVSKCVNQYSCLLKLLHSSKYRENSGQSNSQRIRESNETLCYDISCFPTALPMLWRASRSRDEQYYTFFTRCRTWLLLEDKRRNERKHRWMWKYELSPFPFELI